MRIITTLLVLLTSPLVFAETWVCSEVLENSTPPYYIQQVSFDQYSVPVCKCTGQVSVFVEILK